MIWTKVGYIVMDVHAKTELWNVNKCHTWILNCVKVKFMHKRKYTVKQDSFWAINLCAFCEHGVNAKVFAAKQTLLLLGISLEIPEHKC